VDTRFERPACDGLHRQLDEDLRRPSKKRLDREVGYFPHLAKNARYGAPEILPVHGFVHQEDRRVPGFPASQSGATKRNLLPDVLCKDSDKRP
jgi:hypothetical protein